MKGINGVLHGASMVVATAFSVEKDFKDQRLERTSLATLVEDRQQRIQTLESLLEREKTA